MRPFPMSPRSVWYAIARKWFESSSGICERMRPASAHRHVDFAGRRRRGGCHIHCVPVERGETHQLVFTGWFAVSIPRSARRRSLACGLKRLGLRGRRRKIPPGTARHVATKKPSDGANQPGHRTSPSIRRIQNASQASTGRFLPCLTMISNGEIMVGHGKNLPVEAWDAF